MNKSELIAAVAKSTGIAQKVVKPVVDTLFTTIADTMASGQEVLISGFGTFSNVPVEAHTGRNPKTGDPVEVAAHGKPRFKASNTLKEKCY